MGVGTRIRQARTVVGMYERDKISMKLLRRRAEVFFEDAGSEVSGVGFVRISDCCLQGIQPCKFKGEGHRLVDNQIFR